MGQSKLPIQKRMRDKCPACGSENAKKYRTEKFSATYIVRYYECACGQRFKTEEAR
jgi:DNA-directed RNA polymerase subunit M/transcription elongation factor TFIIS